MASSGYGGPPDQTRPLIAQTKTLLNTQLKQILAGEGLRVSGVKAELQQRIISHIERIGNQGDYEGLQRLRGLLYGHTHPDFSNDSSPSATYLNYTPPSSASPQYPPPMPTYAPRGGAPLYNPYSRQLTFKDSPFYQIKWPLSPVTECKGGARPSSLHGRLADCIKARESTRDTARVNIDVTPDVAELLNKDANYKVMVFCAADMAASTPTEISFPHQVELKCNTNEVKANLRGLKNKPGSTRPADITSFIRRKIPGYQNVLEMVYALTSKAKPALQKYFLVVNLVRKIPIEQLVAQLKHGKIISKERVIKEMSSKAEDSEIQATASVLSLKCPLSATRIATPCRATSCAHNQCFDAASYLMLQEQAPQWSCPLCNKPAPFNSLTIDLYVDNILKSTSSSVEQVTIEPNGSWHQQRQAETPRRSYKNPTPDDDDDLIEISDDRMSSLKADARTSMLGGTPPMFSREPSSVPSAPRSNKRQISQVIDLTGSDDEDEQPPQKIKRPSMSSLASADPYRVPSAGPPRFYTGMPSTNTYNNFDFADSPL